MNKRTINVRGRGKGGRTARLVGIDRAAMSIIHIWMEARTIAGWGQRRTCSARGEEDG